jgi:threonine/homoserine/homoserine lactone efflux protein
VGAALAQGVIGLLATLGVASSEIVQITAVAAGLAALCAAAPAALTVLRLCGAAQRRIC